MRCGLPADSCTCPSYEAAAKCKNTTPVQKPATPVGRFNGPEFDQARDGARLTGQLLRVWDLMKDGQFRTLGAIASRTGDPESSISAQLRHLRKERFGGHTVNRRHIKDGLFEYQLVVASSAKPVQ